MFRASLATEENQECSEIEQLLSGSKVMSYLGNVGTESACAYVRGMIKALR